VSRTDREHLTDALLHFDKAAAYARGSEFDDKTIDAVCMRIAAAVDSLAKVTPSLRDDLFGDAWPVMRGMRNRIAHTYAMVESSVVAATVASDVPPICARIREHLEP
jgi:uncharacterized protein with HEPN domain